MYNINTLMKVVCLLRNSWYYIILYHYNIHPLSFNMQCSHNGSKISRIILFNTAYETQSNGTNTCIKGIFYTDQTTK